MPKTKSTKSPRKSCSNFAKFNGIGVLNDGHLQFADFSEQSQSQTATGSPLKAVMITPPRFPKRLTHQIILNEAHKSSLPNGIINKEFDFEEEINKDKNTPQRPPPRLQTRSSIRSATKPPIDYRETSMKIGTFGTPDREPRRSTRTPRSKIITRHSDTSDNSSFETSIAKEEQLFSSDSEEVDECDSSSSAEPEAENTLKKSGKLNAKFSTTIPVKTEPFSLPPNSPSNSMPDTHNLAIKYDIENYFLATNRVKYRDEDKQSKPSKKPRKGNRTGRDKTDDNLPEKRITDFSITKELNNLDLEVEYEPKHSSEIERLENSIISDFPRWIFLLNEGFNLLLYGYGSKTRIFDAFQRFLQDDFMVIVINGLETKLNPKKFLLNFWSALDLNIELPNKTGHVSSVLEDICTILQNHEIRFKEKVYLLINNLEILGAAQPPKNIMFDVICALSRLEFIHVIGTCDHVNSLLGIEQGKLTGLKLTWINATTFVPYDNEIIWKSAADFGTVDGTDETAKNTLEHVLKSLTANARRAFGILSNLQVQKMKLASITGSKGKKSKDKDFVGVEFHELARKCREGFIAPSDLRLRTLLAEFIDHKLIRQVSNGKSKGSENLLAIDLDMETLEGLATTLA